MGEYTKHVYIAGPFMAPTGRGIELNIREAETVALFVAELGGVPECPHSLGRFMVGTLTEEKWKALDMAKLRRCDALLLMPRWRESSGSMAENDEAAALGLPRFVVTREPNGFGLPLDFLAWLND